MTFSERNLPPEELANLRQDMLADQLGVVAIPKDQLQALLDTAEAYGKLEAEVERLNAMLKHEAEDRAEVELPDAPGPAFGTVERLLSEAIAPTAYTVISKSELAGLRAEILTVKRHWAEDTRDLDELEQRATQAEAALASVQGALADAATVPVGAAKWFGESVRALTRERDAERERAGRIEAELAEERKDREARHVRSRLRSLGAGGGGTRGT